MIKLPHLQPKGFTIIELLVASTVFSVILLICMSGVIKMGQIFFKGTITSQTQEAARSIIDEISQGIQFSGSSVGDTNSGSPVCVGNKRYTYVIDKQLDDTASGPNQKPHVLQRDINSSCSGPLAADAVELLTPGMRLTKFDIKPLDDPDPIVAKLWRVNVWVVYGDEDLLTADDGTGHRQCKGGAGSEYCAVSELSAIVHRRL